MRPELAEAMAADRESLVQDIGDIVSIKSVEEEALPGMPFGEGPAKALQCILKKGEEMGFAVENFDNYAGHIDFGEGEEMLGILGHVDVVPAGEGWDCEPYAATVIDGKLYGRGVLDDKGPIMTCLHAMKILKESGIEPKKKIRLIVGANEETHWGCVNHYFGEVNAPQPDIAIVPDANFPVIYGEKGILEYKLIFPVEEEIVICGGNAVNAVAEKAFIELPEEYAEKFRTIWGTEDRFERETGCSFEVIDIDSEKCRVMVEGEASHACLPEQGKNAISALMYAVDALHIPGDIGKIAEAYNTYIGLGIYGEKLGVAAEDADSGKLTFNVGRVTSEEGSVTFYVDNRIPVTADDKETMAHIEKQIEKTPFTMELLKLTEGILISRDNSLVTTLMDVYRDVTGDTEAQPVTTGGGTYARSLKNGVAFGALLRDQPDHMHKKNEYAEIEKIYTWLEIYLEAIYRLAC